MNSKRRENTQKNKDFSTSVTNDKEFLKLKDIYEKLKKKYGITSTELLSNLNEKEAVIPVSIFNENLSALETIVKYLKENLNLSYREISILIGRSEKTVWQAHNSSKPRFPNKFENITSKYNIPVSLIKNRELSVLENIVSFLKDHFNISYHEIAVLLKRDDRTIWTVYSRARKKNDK